MSEISFFPPIVRRLLHQPVGRVVLLSTAVVMAFLGLAWVVHLPAGSLPLRANQSVARQPDPRAQDLYLRARFLWNLRTEKSLKDAVVLFQAAIAQDPHYAAAYAGLADSYLLMRQYGTMTDADAYARAYEASRHALEADASSLEAHRAYAFVLNFWMWNFPEAEKEFRRALAIDPRNAQTHTWYATSLLSNGRDAEAAREIEIARRLQPDSVIILVNRGIILRRIDPALALSSLREVEQSNPDFAYVHRYLALLYFDAHRDDDFLREYRTYFELCHRASEIAAVNNAEVEFKRHGNQAMLQRLAWGLGQLAEAQESHDAMDAAMLYARLADAPHTLKFLRLSYGRRESGFAVLNREPQYAFLKGDPEFESLIARSNTPAPAPPPPVAPGANHL